jgi:stage II sporulation protein D
MPLVLLALLLVALAPPPALADPEPSVRVRLLDRERPTQVSVRAMDGPADVLLDGRPLLTLNPGGSVTVESASGAVVVRAFGTTERGRTVTLAPREGSPLKVLAGRTERPYRGALEIAADGSGARPPLRLVNVVSMEDYVASVVPAEYPFPEIEGVKAQAVLVRTYALRARGRYGTHDVVDHVGSQVYRGVESETALARRAATETRGEVLTFNGTLVDAVYSSSSGGHTASNESIWTGPPVPYLRARPDPYDHASPNYRWNETIESDRLLRALSRHYGFNVTGIAIGGTSPEGRVTSVRLTGARTHTEQANRFRLTVNQLVSRNLLKSTFFTMERSSGRYVFTGRGFGHGVGMSQYGAREQARQGRDYRDILAFYYTGVTLERPGGALRTLLAERPGAEAPSAPPPVVAPPPERMEPLPPAPPSSTPGSRFRARRTGW